jgi:flagellar basal-body rod modification protein FlgD
MQIDKMAQSNNAGPAASTPSNNNSNNNDMFLKLLVAQLKNQSSLDPVDPNQFVAQLAQFNTLNEVIQIRQLMQQFSAAGSKTSGSAMNSSIEGGQ